MHSASFNNPNNLPLEVFVAIEEHVPETPATPTVPTPDSADNLVQRLTAIRQRLFYLQAVWANTLSHDVALEADRYRLLFRDLAEELRKQDPEAVDRLIAGHEALLLADHSNPKPTLPITAQRWFELSGEVRSERNQPPKPRSANYVPDGLQRFV